MLDSSIEYLYNNNNNKSQEIILNCKYQIKLLSFYLMSTFKQIETALKKTRTFHNFYYFIVITIFLISNTAVYSTLTGIPFYQYEKKYLCKAENSEKFNIECSKKFICNDNVELGVDYIVDEENTVELKSIISEFKLKCNDKRVILLNIFYFFGTLVGILLIPILNVHFGTLTTLFLSGNLAL